MLNGYFADKKRKLIGDRNTSEGLGRSIKMQEEGSQFFMPKSYLGEDREAIISMVVIIKLLDLNASRRCKVLFAVSSTFPS